MAVKRINYWRSTRQFFKSLLGSSNYGYNIQGSIKRRTNGEIEKFVARGRAEFKDQFGWAYNNVYKNKLKTKPNFVSDIHKDAYYLMFDYLLQSDKKLCYKRRDEAFVLSDFNFNNFIFGAATSVFSISLFMEPSIFATLLFSLFVISLFLFLILVFFRFKQCNDESYSPYWVDHSENQRIGYFLHNNYFYKSKDPSGQEWSSYLKGLTPLNVARVNYNAPSYIPRIEEDDSKIVKKGKRMFGCTIVNQWNGYKGSIVEPKYVNSNHELEFQIMFNYLEIVDEKIKSISRQLDDENFNWNVYQYGLLIICAINSFAFYIEGGNVKNWMMTMFFSSAILFVYTIFSRINYNLKNDCWSNGENKWSKMRANMLIEDCPYYGGQDPLGVPWVDYFRNHKISRKRPKERKYTEEEIAHSITIN